jgi:hypothetical protein
MDRGAQVANARLRAQRHHRPLRRPRRRLRAKDRGHDFPAPRRGVPSFPQPHRQRPPSISCWTTPQPTRPRGSNAGWSATRLQPAVHADLQLVARSRRALVRPTHQWITRRSPTDADATSLPRSAHGSPLGRPKPYIWHKTLNEVLYTFAACRGINDSGH